jgi:arylsulfatase A-like enzyme
MRSLIARAPFFFAVAISLLKACHSENFETAPNVLFIAVDDWNDWVGCLDGKKEVITPNLDILASKGALFTEAHCAAPVCNPSRTAILLGRMPSSTGVYENAQWWLPNVPDAISLPAFFRKNGYLVTGSGKLFHHTAGFNDPEAWDQYYIWNEKAKKNGLTEVYHYPEGPGPEDYPASEVRNRTKRNFDFAPLDIPDDEMPDGKVAAFAANFLSKKHEKPFFLGVGMFRPHIEWYVPRKYFDMYPPESLSLPPYLENDLEDVPEPGRNWALNAGSQHEFIKQSGNWEKAMQGYLASISFSDAQVGKVLDALENGPNAENTIIVLWSDHGYHLGEKEHWHKSTLWYRSTHVPLIMVVPGLTEAGQVISKPVSLINLYKTLVDLCDLPELTGLDGVSMKPLLSDENAEWNQAVRVDYQPGNTCVYTEKWHYIRYADGTDELYDLEADPHEWENLAAEEAFTSLIDSLKGLIPHPFADPVPGKNAFDFDPQKYQWKKKEDGTITSGFSDNIDFSWLTNSEENE